MSSSAFAPRAEPDPEVPMYMTAEELIRLPDEACGYELVEGRLIRMSPTGGEHSYVFGRLYPVLLAYVEAHHLGFVSALEMGFHLNKPSERDTVLAPDIAYVRADRVPARRSAEWRSLWRLAPDLAVEIASPR
jgi:Uma2 family endonuclease